jgi:hypothetical protein
MGMLPIPPGFQAGPINALCLRIVADGAHDLLAPPPSKQYKPPTNLRMVAHGGSFFQIGAERARKALGAKDASQSQYIRARLPTLPRAVCTGRWLLIAVRHC